VNNPRPKVFHKILYKSQMTNVTITEIQNSKTNSVPSFLRNFAQTEKDYLNIDPEEKVTKLSNLYQR